MFIDWKDWWWDVNFPQPNLYIYCNSNLDKLFGRNWRGPAKDLEQAKQQYLKKNKIGSTLVGFKKWHNVIKACY